MEKELHSLYRSPNIAKAIKSRRLRWAVHVARISKIKLRKIIILPIVLYGCKIESLTLKEECRPRH